MSFYKVLDDIEMNTDDIAGLTDTTYTLVNTGDSTAGTGTVTLTPSSGTGTAFTLAAGNNITISLTSDTFTIASPNFSSIHPYDTVADRNAAADVVWHVGDIALVTADTDTTLNGTYIYSGTDQTVAGTTMDADWTLLPGPGASVGAAGILTSLNQNDGMTKINDNLIDTSVADLSDSTITDVAANQFLRYDDTTSMWLNTTVEAIDNLPTGAMATGSYILTYNDAADAGMKYVWGPVPDSEPLITTDDAAPATPADGQLWFYTGGDNEGSPRLFVAVTDSANSTQWIAASPTPELPSAPAAVASNTNYSLQVTDAGILSWTPIAQASITATLTKQTGSVATVASQATYNVSDFTGITTIEAMHLLIYNGLTLIEGVDYNVNDDRDAFTLVTNAVNEIDAGDFLYIINTTVTAST